MRYLVLFSACVLLTQCGPSPQNDGGKGLYKKWQHYLGDPARSHYSTLSEFNSENIKSLKIAWEYQSKDFGQMQMNPIVVDSLLYGVSAALRAFALDARTGEEVWVFGDSLKTWFSTSRGVTYWESGEDKRIFYTIGSDLWALNALTGNRYNRLVQTEKLIYEAVYQPPQKKNLSSRLLQGLFLRI